MTAETDKVHPEERLEIIMKNLLAKTNQAVRMYRSMPEGSVVISPYDF